MARRSAVGGLLVAVVVLLGSGRVAADEASRAEVAEWAEAAAGGDRQALEHLRDVTEIDGRPVDLDPMLGGDEAERSARLADLADALGAGEEPGSADGAAVDRTRAAEVLEQDEYHEPDLPRPFREPLQWLGDRITALWDGAVSLLSPVFGTRGAALVLVAAVGAALVALIIRLATRRSVAATRAGVEGHFLVDPSLDPDDLERRADEASRSGDHAAAVRLRYEAGLLRLLRSGRLELRAETTASDAARQVDDPAMDELTTSFEEIVYGGRPATPADDDAARDGWRRLLGRRVAR